MEVRAGDVIINVDRVLTEAESDLVNGMASLLQAALLVPENIAVVSHAMLCAILVSKENIDRIRGWNG